MITLRLVKGDALTYEELDGNFTTLVQYVDAANDRIDETNLAIDLLAEEIDVINTQLAQFFGFHLSEDGTDLLLDTGLADFNASDYIIWYIGPVTTYDVVDNSLVLVVS